LLQLSSRAEGDRIVPRYLTERDHPWLRALLDEYVRFEGRKRTELAARLREPLSSPAPRVKLRIAARVLESMTKDRASSAIPPAEARWRVFRAAAENARPRDAILRLVADETNLTPGDLDEALFADLRGERRVTALPSTLTPASLASKANLAIVSSLLRRAATVRITAFGDASALVRHAKRLGLICNVELVRGKPRLHAVGDATGTVLVAEEPALGTVIHVSGPLALFHHTGVYGKALASLVPRVGHCHDFELVAQCALGRGKHLSRFVLRSGDLIVTGEDPQNGDSDPKNSPQGGPVEKRFARDFRRAAPEWRFIREPDPVDASGTLMFPSFELVHRSDRERRWLVEIVGFWTAEYLREKLARLRAAGLSRFVLCIDARRQCHDEPLPDDARVVRYLSKIDPTAVLAIVEG
jgi:predicted nuclease of restriction endonuclease-like RecB superfamily